MTDPAQNTPETETDPAAPDPVIANATLRTAEMWAAFTNPDHLGI